MKKFPLLILVCILFSHFKLKAQDDPNVGFYVDGIKVSELTCYSFKTLTVVLPYNESYTLFDRLVVVAKLTPTSFQPGLGIAQTISKAELMTKYLKGKYIVYQIYKEGSQRSCSTAERYTEDLCRGVLAFYQKKDSAAADLQFTLEGQSITSYEEKYYESCQCFKREAVYDVHGATNLSDIKIPLKNRTLVGGWALKTTCQFDVDLSQPCTYPGTRVDVNNLGNATNTSSTSNAKTTTTTTPSTVSTTAAGPYSEKHENGKISVQGQKNKEGEQEGTWKYFDENGKLERIENYKKGIADGEWKYYEEGKLSKTEVYKGGEMISETEVE